MKDGNLWKQQSIDQNLAIIDLYRRIPPTLTINFFFDLKLLVYFHRGFFWHDLVNQSEHNRLLVFSLSQINVESLKLPCNNLVSVHAHSFSKWPDIHFCCLIYFIFKDSQANTCYKFNLLLLVSIFQELIELSRLLLVFTPLDKH